MFWVHCCIGLLCCKLLPIMLCSQHPIISCLSVKIWYFVASQTQMQHYKHFLHLHSHKQSCNYSITNALVLTVTQLLMHTEHHKCYCTCSIKTTVVLAASQTLVGLQHHKHWCTYIISNSVLLNIITNFVVLTSSQTTVLAASHCINSIKCLYLQNHRLSSSYSITLLYLHHLLVLLTVSCCCIYSITNTVIHIASPILLYLQ